MSGGPFRGPLLTWPLRGHRRSYSRWHPRRRRRGARSSVPERDHPTHLTPPPFSDLSQSMIARSVNRSDGAGARGLGVPFGARMRPLCAPKGMLGAQGSRARMPGRIRATMAAKRPTSGAVTQKGHPNPRKPATGSPTRPPLRDVAEEDFKVLALRESLRKQRSAAGPRRSKTRTSRPACLAPAATMRSKVSASTFCEHEQVTRIPPAATVCSASAFSRSYPLRAASRSLRARANFGGSITTRSNARGVAVSRYRTSPSTASTDRAVLRGVGGDARDRPRRRVDGRHRGRAGARRGEPEPARVGVTSSTRAPSREGRDPARVSR